mmetsp:Transcript_126756/g.364568  ORF Transcript_126756/g.364568 Transcript_126756/m.364568 type:complete len:216 (+) Transcript_126756:753-1400(+)
MSASCIRESTSAADMVLTNFRYMVPSSTLLKTPLPLMSALWKVALRTCCRKSLDTSGKWEINDFNILSVGAPAPSMLPPGPMNSGSASGTAILSATLALSRKMPKYRFKWFSWRKTPSWFQPNRCPLPVLHEREGAPGKKPATKILRFLIVSFSGNSQPWSSTVVIISPYLDGSLQGSINSSLILPGTFSIAMVCSIAAPARGVWLCPAPSHKPD